MKASEGLFDPAAWADTSSDVAQRVAEKSRAALASYREDPLLIEEHANKELGTAQGGYGRRQVYELIQNAADELLTEPGGTIEILLTAEALYCANEGTPISTDGVNAILMSDLSVKRGNEIGRFGLGFKSVLAITRRPLFLSRSGSFQFDPDAADREIHAVAPTAQRIPYLRLATPTDPVEAMRSDAVLEELMAWSTTVVKLPRDLDAAGEPLRDDVASFPPEFLLFSPHVGQVVREDRTSGVRHTATVRKDGSGLLLSEDGKDAAWSVFKADYIPSAAAKADAGEVAGRDVVPIIWAVRRDGARGRGRFWAFFPTEAGTTLSGIINAPWKTNEDRQNLLKGLFNEELIGAVADLVVSNLAALQSYDDPGRLFDILPARGREAPSWADGLLTDTIYGRAALTPSIPDQTGQLAMPEEVRRHPSGTPSAALEAWAAYSHRPTAWMHRSVETRERRSKAEHIAERSRIATYAEWLEALVEDRSAGASIAALRVASACLASDLLASEQASVRSARILLTSDGGMAAIVPSEVFSSRGDTSSKLAKFVHPDVEIDTEAARILEEMGIRAVDREDEYTLLVDALTWDYEAWDHFWSETKTLVSAERALILIRARPEQARLIRFRTVAGTFAGRRDVILPGSIVPEDGGEDPALTVDVQFHQGTLEIIQGLGVHSEPKHDGMHEDERWFRDYRDEMVDQYVAATRSLQQKPSRELLRLNQHGVLGPLDPLERLSDAGAARFTQAILNSEPDSRSWAVRHDSNALYPVIPVEDPVSWLVKKFGLIPTSLGPRVVGRAVGPTMRQLAAVLPAADCSAIWAGRLGLAESPSAVDLETWAEAFEAALTAEPARASELYATACPFAGAPDRLRCLASGNASIAPTGDTFVTSDPIARDSLAETAAPIVFVPDPQAAVALATHWGLQLADGLVESRAAADPAGDPQPLVEAFPALRAYLGRQQAQLELVRCTDLRREIIGPSGLRSTPAEFMHEDGRIYWRETSDDGRLLERLSLELDLGLSVEDVAQIIADREDDVRQKLIVAVRAEPDAPTKLLRAIGREAIIRHVSEELLAGVEEARGALSDSDLARLAESIFGIDLFREFKDELRQSGFNPPERWAGSPTARRFVAALGLPRPYAGFEDPRLDPLLDVDGPAVLPELHDFQEELTGRIRNLLRAPTGKRALLSLPTGAGKTRVTVEALVRAIIHDGLEGPILWTAPTAELCEQAVQTWAYVWRSVGPRKRLHISRLWESKEAEESSDDGIQVVVATAAKMGYVIEKSEYDWLAAASVVVVDEAHGSTETGYTQIFHWLGLGRGQSSDRCPLIGLTATPFKGLSEEATARLAARYGKRRLDEGVLGDDPIHRLQEMDVLARAKQMVLGGSTIELTPAEAAKAKAENRLPPEVEQRVGEDRSRNRVLLDTIISLPDDWKVLVFAASVSHARQMAAILNLEGVESAVVSSDTNPAARRHYVKQFNSGSLRVLTNYGVFAEGFDAPSVRAVVIARPTLSPGSYQQMVGRGLRGPRNGGKEECLIVNVADNILQFGGDLAFRHFDYLFDER